MRAYPHARVRNPLPCSRSPLLPSCAHAYLRTSVHAYIIRPYSMTLQHAHTCTHPCVQTVYKTPTRHFAHTVRRAYVQSPFPTYAAAPRQCPHHCDVGATCATCDSATLRLCDACAQTAIHAPYLEPRSSDFVRHVGYACECVFVTCMHSGMQAGRQAGRTDGGQAVAHTCAQESTQLGSAHERLAGTPRQSW